MGKTKATLDTNILISALGWLGNPHKILEKVINKEIELIISDKQFEELSNTLDYPHLDFTQEQKDKIKSIITELATFVNPQETLNIIKSDPDDNAILECALAGNAEYIVSGDPHLLDLKEFRGIKIITASQFLELVANKS